MESALLVLVSAEVSDMFCKETGLARNTLIIQLAIRASETENRPNLNVSANQFPNFCMNLMPVQVLRMIFSFQSSISYSVSLLCLFCLKQINQSIQKLITRSKSGIKTLNRRRGKSDGNQMNCIAAFRWRGIIENFNKSEARNRTIHSWSRGHLRVSGPPCLLGYLSL
jgi:hypothetical protein